MVRIKQNLKATHDKQKSYENKGKSLGGLKLRSIIFVSESKGGFSQVGKLHQGSS